ncbi:hypothetical protein ABMA08_11730 [Pseudomonas yamanorum]
MGHPWPRTANLASCQVTHTPKPAFGQRGLTGRLRSRSKADQEHSGLPAGLSAEEQNQKLKRARFKCGSWLACDGITSVYLKNRVVCIAGKPAPTEKQIFFRSGYLIVPTLCVGMHTVTLRVTIARGVNPAVPAGRGASEAAFPRRAWERSPSPTTPQYANPPGARSHHTALH